MNMNKITYWIIGLLSLAFIIAVFFGIKFFTNVSNSNPSNPAYITTNVGTPINVPVSGAGGQGNTISIASAYGGTIQVKDFENDPVFAKDPVNSGYYYFGYHFSQGVSDSTATDTPPYVIEYIGSTQYFSIALLQEPIGQSRQEMEQYLMTHLGITQNQMCQLKYMVSVPASVDPTYAGTGLGFSFCPGATQLP
jgi:hypothetical protein